MKYLVEGSDGVAATAMLVIRLALSTNRERPWHSPFLWCSGPSTA
jgi:hypothetical protein